MSWLKQFSRRFFYDFGHEQENSANPVQDEGYRIILNRYLAGKFFPLNRTGVYHLLLKPSATPRQEANVALPMPPKDMWEGYGLTEQEYLASGRRHMAAIKQILQSADSPAEEFRKVLDFGCAAGRLLRFYPHERGRSELWGVDINARYISWCQNHLSPPFLFATITTAPHLPFEDNYFDMIYCGSVFTHITDLADAWFLELRRVVRKGGYALITIQDKTSMDILLSQYSAKIAAMDPSERNWDKPDGEPGTASAAIHLMNEFDNTIDLRSLDYISFSFSSDPYSNIFYDIECLIDKWSRLSEIVSVTPQAYGCQTALLCRKR
jgi:SAM-dependent methyltransferase